MMAKTVEELKYRMHLLKVRDEIGNAGIINKIKRNIRKLESKK